MPQKSSNFLSFFARIQKKVYLCGKNWSCIAMKRNYVQIFTLILLSILAIACEQTYSNKKRYLIGVSQCSNDAWRTKMNEEMQRELIFHPEISLDIRHADDNSPLQCLQIDSFIAEDVDLLIVCPNEAEEVKPAVSRAYDAGIPVIIAERQVTGEKYTAFIGGDNYAVGRHMASWLQSCAKKLAATPQEPLQVVEIMGLAGSTPCVWRHAGLIDGLKTINNVKLMGSGNANWFAAPARVVADSLLRCYPKTDVIVAQNDIMAIAAAEVAEKLTYARDIYGEKRGSIHVLGTDAMTGKGGGVEAVLQGKIDASITYASRGDMVIQTAVKILNKEPYSRDTILPIMLVDPAVAETMHLMSHEIEHNMATIQALQHRITWLRDMSQLQRVLLCATVACIIILLMLIIVTWWGYKYRKRVRIEREENARTVANQQRQLENIMAELERTKASQSQDEQFTTRLKEQIELNLNNSEFSVEMLSDALGVSRTQLFRKTKQLMGVTPIDLIRRARLRKAQQLLLNTDANIQQVAYEVGFTSPSYFTKCYKEFFGRNPSKEYMESNE